MIVNLHAQLNMLGRLDAAPDGALARLAARARSRMAGAAREAHRAPGGNRDSRLLRRRGDVLGGRGAPRLPRRVVRLRRSPRSSRGSRSCSCRPSLLVLAGFAAYAAAAWRMTARQRAAGRASIAAAPRVYSGTIPRRVRRRSPAALAGYELPLGLMGFPGVGWLFAGFPFTASILLLAGTGADVGRDPGRLQPRTGRGRCGMSAGRSSSSGCPRWRCSRPLCSTAPMRAGVPASTVAPRAARRSGSAATAPGSALPSAGWRFCSWRFRSSLRSRASVAAPSATRTSRG